MRLRIAALLALIALAAGAVAVASTGSEAPARGGKAEPRKIVFGESAKGRALVARRLGSGRSGYRVLVVGMVHGDERAGLGIVRDLRRRHRRVGGELFVVDTVNPDGRAAGTRGNSRGVDLNRNFAENWSGEEPRSSGYYAGPYPFSEPESKALRDLIRRIEPDLTIHYHQPWGQVLAACKGDARLERLYSEKTGLPMKRCRGQGLPGTITSWQESRFPRSESFVVELPPGALGTAATRRHSNAVASLTRVASGGPLVAAPTQARRDLAALKPKIVDRLIPFPKRRKREMAGYSQSHYGEREWRLRDSDVRTIVEHYSVSSTTDSVYNAFAPDRPDPEFGQLPNVCSHYVIDGSGRITRLVPLTIRCRHTVGLNHRSIGIEHTGFTETDILRNRRQLAASIRLTRWLRCRYDLKVSDVIGHNESLSSPHYRELDPRFKGQTHGDWRPRYMSTYRKLLRSRGACPKRG